MKFSITKEDMLEREKRILENLQNPDKRFKPNKPQSWKRSSEFVEILWLYAFRRVNPQSKLRLEQINQIAISKTMEFFFSDWHEKHDKDQNEQRKVKTNDELRWYKPIRVGALAAILEGDQQLLSRLADWVEPWMKPELNVDLQGGEELFYFQFFSSYRNSPVFENDLSILRTSQPTGVRLNTLCLIESADFSGATKNLAKSLKSYQSSIRNPIVPYECISVEDSILYSLLEETSLTRVEITPELSMSIAQCD